MIKDLLQNVTIAQGIFSKIADLDKDSLAVEKKKEQELEKYERAKEKSENSNQVT